MQSNRISPYVFDDIPSMTREQAAALNMLLGAPLSLPRDVLLDFVEGDVSLRVLSVGFRHEAPRAATLFCGVHLPTQQSASLYLETELVLRVIDAAVGVESERSPTRLLTEAEAGIVDAMLLVVCEQLGLPFLLVEAPSGSGTALTSEQSAASPGVSPGSDARQSKLPHYLASPARGVSASFELSVGDVKGLGLLVLEPGILPASAQREIPWWVRLSTKTARLVVGSASFTQEEFSSLAASDTIIPDSLTCDELGNGLGYVRVDTLTQEVVISNWRSTAQGSWMEEKKIPSGATVELSIELGRTSLRLQDLAQWQPGAIVPIGHKPEDPVHIVSNGKVVAHGQLVRIDNELGIRLTWVEK